MISKLTKTLLGLAILFATMMVQAEPINYHGRIIKESNSQPLIASDVRFNFKIKASASCVVYEENFDAVDMSSSNGYFSFNIGQGSVVYGNFDNAMLTDGSSVVCQNSSIVALSFATQKSIQATIYEFQGGSYSSLVSTISNVNLQNVPSSISAKNLQGKLPSDFIQSSGSVSQSSLEQLASGSSSLYLTGAAVNGKMDKSANLSDVASASTARNNLGLGALSTLSSVGNSHISDLDYSKLSGVPSSFAPSAHSHVMSDVTGLSSALSAKLDSSAFNGYVASANCSSSQTMYWNSVSSQFACSNISFTSLSIGPANDPEMIITDIDNSGSFSQVSGGHGILSKHNKGHLFLITENNSDADDVQTNHVLIETGNKTAGTGDSGSILLAAGASAGGERGGVFVDALGLFPVEDADFSTYAVDLGTTDQRWANIWGRFISATDSIGLRDQQGNPTFSAAVTGPLFGLYTGPFWQAPTNFASYNSFGFRGRNNGAGDSLSTHHLVMFTGDKINGTGNTGNVVLRTGLLQGAAVGTRGNIVLNARNIDVSNTNIVNVATPIAGTDAANKSYVDGQVSTNVVKTPGITAPKMCSFFVSNSNGSETPCSSGTCATQNIKGSCANSGSVTRSATGSYSFAPVGGFFSDFSTVNCTASYSVCSGSGVCNPRVSNSISSSTRAFVFYDLSNNPQDASFSVICHGE